MGGFRRLCAENRTFFPKFSTNSRFSPRLCRNWTKIECFDVILAQKTSFLAGFLARRPHFWSDFGWKTSFFALRPHKSGLRTSFWSDFGLETSFFALRRHKIGFRRHNWPFWDTFWAYNGPKHPGNGSVGVDKPMDFSPDLIPGPHFWPPRGGPRTPPKWSKKPPFWGQKPLKSKNSWPAVPKKKKVHLARRSGLL